jgi:hypothetical protein
MASKRSELERQIQESLPDAMVIPKPLSNLFSWIEREGLFRTDGRVRTGFLAKAAYLDPQGGRPRRTGGTDIEFAPYGRDVVPLWLGTKEPSIVKRLQPFARTGADGSMAAFWLDGGGRQQIVHMGSGSGSALVCILAETPLDFLRLLAIGYDELCWSEHFGAPNTALRSWLREAYSAEPPATGAEIVKHRAQMGDADSPDPFCRWVASIT